MFCLYINKNVSLFSFSIFGEAVFGRLAELDFFKLMNLNNINSNHTNPYKSIQIHTNLNKSPDLWVKQQKNKRKI